jgi:hypothetical protein
MYITLLDTSNIRQLQSQKKVQQTIQKYNTQQKQQTGAVSKAPYNSITLQYSCPRTCRQTELPNY